MQHRPTCRVDVKYRGVIRVRYPLDAGAIVLRTEDDWDRDVPPGYVDPGRETFDFPVESERPYLDFKPCLRTASGLHWACGANRLAILSHEAPQESYPYFRGDSAGSLSGNREVLSAALGRAHEFRAYLPAGYSENTLKRYPVLYMLDGANLFFDEEAYLGNAWHVDRTLVLLNSMCLIDQVIVIGIRARDREKEYTQGGFERFGDAIAGELKPHVDDDLRTLRDPAHTMVAGSSLGGVAAFSMAWRRPEVFGGAACLSATFGYRDDLQERVRTDPMDSRRQLKIYLDSGWPGDNYEATLGIAKGLIARGLFLGANLLHLAFPCETHDERSWSARFHLPVQFFAGKLRRAAEWSSLAPHT